MKIWPFHRQKKQFDIMSDNTSIHRRSERRLAANGQEDYCLPTAKPSFVQCAVELLKKNHGFQITGPIANGGNEIVAQVRREDITLYVAWDIWCGFDILSLSDAADPVVRELATYFDAIKYEGRFAKHFDDTQQAEQGVAPNRSQPPTQKSTSSVRGSED
jgi:hypothetical protein